MNDMTTRISDLFDEHKSKMFRGLNFDMTNCQYPIECQMQQREFVFLCHEKVVFSQEEKDSKIYPSCYILTSAGINPG
jgi:hypothetical protein